MTLRHLDDLTEHERDALDLDILAAPIWPFGRVETAALCAKHSVRLTPEHVAIRRSVILREAADAEAAQPKRRAAKPKRAKVLRLSSPDSTADRNNRILDLLAAGWNQCDVAREVRVTTATVAGVVRRARQRGDERAPPPLHVIDRGKASVRIRRRREARA